MSGDATRSSSKKQLSNSIENEVCLYKFRHLNSTHRRLLRLTGEIQREVVKISTVGHTRMKDDFGSIPVSLIKFVTLPQSVGDPGKDFLRRRNTVIHELGQLFGATVSGGAPYAAMSTAVARDDNLKRDEPTVGSYYGFASQFGYFTWQQSYSNAESYREIFADQFLGWTFDTWFSLDPKQYPRDAEMAKTRKKWMDQRMPGWITG